MDKKAHEENITRAKLMDVPPLEKPTAYITVGLPASGKTTWAKNFIEVRQRLGEKPPKRVNKDTLRDMLDFGEYTTDNEMVIRAIQKTIVRALLYQGWDVIIDDTNLKDYPLIWEDDIGDLAKVKIVDFMDVDSEECGRRDALRKEPVGEGRIKAMSNRHEAHIAARLSE